MRIATVLFFVAIGCSGRIQTGAPSGIAGNGPVSSTEPVGAVGLHRLNSFEYDNTVRDLLGDASHPSQAFPPDDGVGGFTNNAQALSISPVLMEAYSTAADTLATNAFLGSAKAQIMTCDPVQVGADACAKQILTSFLKRAWRRPPTADELTEYAAFPAVAQAQGQTFTDGIQLAVRAALASPNFLFRPELSVDFTNTNAQPLNSYELASRLSYFLWSSMPDDALMAAADQGTLTSADVLASQAERMLKDSKAQALLDEFVTQWLIATLPSAMPDPVIFPAFNENIRADMLAETKTFIGSLLSGTESFLGFLDANYTYVNSELASFYGIPAPSGAGFQRVALDGTHRSGILTHGSFLTMTAIQTRTSPVRRGEWVLAELLCSPPPPPPPGVPALPQTDMDGGTMRERMAQHMADPNCSSCHSVMDPIGFGLENFDGIGQYRTTDGTAPIDATGTLPGGTAFDGALQLASALKADSRLPGCVAKKFFSYALGRQPSAQEPARMQALAQGFVSQGYQAEQLVLSIVRNEAFRLQQGTN